MTSAFQSYKVTQATYFKSDWKKTRLYHLEGPALPNAFDKMIEFMNEKGWEKKVG
ncbi:MAG: hypothetical protein U0T82_03330 [Bacteroidales bacterium]